MDERIASQASARDGGASERAATAARAGAIVALPLETGCAFAARLDSDALARLLDALAGARPDNPPIAARLLDSPQSLLSLAPPQRLAHRLLMRRLTPGPVVFEVDAARLGSESRPASLRDQPWARLRVSARVEARALTRALADAPLLAVEPARDQPSEPALAGAADALAWLDAHELGADAVALAAAAGDPASARGPSILRLPPGGLTQPPFEVVHPGAYEERYIRAQLTRTALFVCTGNTCRSPMAEAIARDFLERQGEPDPAVTTSVFSAGAATMGGAPVSAEAVKALDRLGVALDPRGRSRPLTRDALAQADIVFAMGARHADAVRRLDPAIADRVQLLDPAGQDIADPVGGPQTVYDSTARRLQELVGQRMREPWP